MRIRAHSLAHTNAETLTRTHAHTQGIILSLPHPWCDLHDAASAQHIYDGFDESQRMAVHHHHHHHGVLLHAGRSSSNNNHNSHSGSVVSIEGAFSWVAGALVQLESLGPNYEDYKAALRLLLCRDVLWRAAEVSESIRKGMRVCLFRLTDSLTG
jgi:hypothetical protein